MMNIRNKYINLATSVLAMLGVICTPFLLRVSPALAAADQIYVAPSVQSVNRGHMVSVDVHEDSGTDAMNAVQANVTYPTSLKVISVSAASGWSEAQNDTSTPGIIYFAAFPTPNGSTKTNDQVFETITFQAAGSGVATLGFGCDLDPSTCPNGNAITRASDSANILTGEVGGNLIINSSSVLASEVTTSTTRIVSRVGGTLLAKDGLTDPWSTEATGLGSSTIIYAAGDRIGFLDNGNLYVKQGLSGGWAKVGTSVDDAVLTANRIVMRVSGTLLAKDGLSDPWSVEMTGLNSSTQLMAAGDRIGVLDSTKSLYVKQGLSGGWLKESTSVDDALLTPTRMVVRSSNTMAAKDGMTDSWSKEATGITLPAQIFAAGDRLGFLDGSKGMIVKQGLNGQWYKVASAADDAMITPTRILVRNGSTLAAKDGLTDSWSILKTGVTLPAQIYIAGDRTGVNDSGGSLYVKQGLSGAWYKESNNTDDSVLTW